ncbi:hypothetical protein KQI63_00285 [bacterium]|nr:hypothetical protein [bacterium]
MRRTSTILRLLPPFFLILLLVSGIAQGRERRYGKDNPFDVKPTEAVRNPDRGVYDGLGRSTNGATRLLRAIELRQEETAGGEVVYLEGDVKLIQDSLTIWCDRANHRRSRGVLELFGDVIMIDPEKRLSADQVVYYEEIRRSLARGNVEMIQDSVVLTSQQGQYDEQANLATFEREMKIYDLRRDVQLTGKVGTYDTERKNGRVPLDPVLTSYDSLGVEEARITGLQMEYDSDDGYATVTDSVTLSWHDVRGYCDLLYYYSDLDKALMVGSPRVFRDRDEAEGDSIWLYVTEGALDSVVIKGQAIAFTPSDSSEYSPRSTLEGRRIVMDFEEGKVSRMQSDGQAVGIYHIFDEHKDQGSNRVSGDRVVLMMGEKGLTDVLVNGGTEGKFLPPRMAKELRRGDR